MRFLLLLLVAALTFTGCKSSQPADIAGHGRADYEFADIAEEFLDGYLAWRPATGTALGYHQYDGKITDYSRPSLDAELARLKHFDGELGTFDTSLLVPRSFYDYRILRAAIAKEVFKFEDRQAYSQNPMTYAGALNVLIYIKRDFAPFEERVRSLVAILRQAPALMAAARANLDESLPRPYIETAIEVANGSADFLAKDLVEALKPLTDPALRQEFTIFNQVAIDQLHAYAKWLKEQKLPLAHDNYALGRAKYARMLRDGEYIALSPERLLALGLAELKREQDAFATAAHQIDASKKPIEVFKEIQRDHPTEESLIPDTRKNLDAIRQFLIDHHIVTLPSDVRARVEETPPFDRATSFASMDTPGPFETKATEAYYYVTPVEKHWTPQQKDEWLTAFNYYTTDIVSIHEAYPGHYVQFLCLNASPANRLEKILDSYAFVEGWAHYTEQMLLDEGFPGCAGALPTPAETLRAAKYRLAQSDEALLRLCRLCVSIQMHCLGMGVEDATRFFMNNCYYEEKPARQEAIRGTYDPEYLYYTLGKLQILKLRDDWIKDRGPDYSLQEFHDGLLRHGMPPIRLLRERMLRDDAIWDESFPPPGRVPAGTRRGP